MPYTLQTADPRARPADRALELGTLRTFMRGDPRRPWPALVVMKARDGTSRAWLEEVRDA